MIKDIVIVGLLSIPVSIIITMIALLIHDFEEVEDNFVFVLVPYINVVFSLIIFIKSLLWAFEGETKFLIINFLLFILKIPIKLFKYIVRVTKTIIKMQ